MPTKPDTIAGVFDRHHVRFDSGTFVGSLECGTIIKGRDPQEELVPGLSYRFYGRWEDYANKRTRQTEKQFCFTQFVKSEPHSKYGLVKYLERYARNIGPSIAGRLFDAFGSDTVKILRTDPARASAAVKGLALDKATEAAETLSKLGANEDAKIELMQLFSGRGFPHSLTDEVIKRWGILAPARIRRDPLSLMVGRFPGCGWNRCNRLYTELGLPPDRLKRQMLCLWHLIRTETEGDTWHNETLYIAKMRSAAAGATEKSAKRAIRLGIRSGWLAGLHVAGANWIAEGKAAANEKLLAECLIRLTSWQPPAEPDAPQSVEREEPTPADPFAGMDFETAQTATPAADPSRTRMLKTPRLSEMFKRATANGNSLKIRFDVDRDSASTPVKFKGNDDGSLFYIFDAYGCLGAISADGRCNLSHSISSQDAAWIAGFVQQFEADPAEFSGRHGRLMGKCCFCGKGLLDSRSTDVGYGPTCAIKFGLPWGDDAPSFHVSAQLAADANADAAAERSLAHALA